MPTSTLPYTQRDMSLQAVTISITPEYDSVALCSGHAVYPWHDSAGVLIMAASRE